MKNSDLALLLLLAVLIMCLHACNSPGEHRDPPPQSDEAPPEMSDKQLDRFARAERELSANDSLRRRQAAVQLLGMGHEWAVEAVRTKMRSTEDTDVRVDMIRAAAFTIEHDCFEDILRSLNAAESAVRNAAAEALPRFSRPEEVQTMKHMLQDPSVDTESKTLLIEATGKGLFVDAIPILIDALDNDDPKLRKAALKSLESISGQSYGPDHQKWTRWWEANRNRSREKLLEERVWNLRAELQAAEQETHELKAELEDFSRLVREDAPKNPTSLLQALLNPHKRVREYAAFRLSRISNNGLEGLSLDDRKTYEILDRTLKQGSPVVQEDIVDLIVSLDGRYRRNLLETALDTDSSTVLVRTIEGIKGEFSDKILRRLRRCLQHGDTEVREAAANALGRSRSRDAIPALMDVLEDPGENVRWFAVEGLRKLEAERAVPQLCELLAEDESARVREIVATALGELDQPGAIPSLRKALDDENERVRNRAASALKSLAAGSFDKTGIVAEAFTQNEQHAQAAEVLRDIIDEYGEEEEETEKVQQTRRKLADVLKQDGQYRDAAEVLTDMIDVTEDEPALRRELADCWVLAEEPDRAVAIMKDWLEENDTDTETAIKEGIDLIETLEREDEQEGARELARLLVPSAEETMDEEVINTLKTLAGMDEKDE
ncbi:MAG: HEAT repeat domain-containing protein, partial [Candidatus Brocadiia bacterium]